MVENSDLKRGIPTLLRTAILLKRKETESFISEKFEATVDIEAEVEFVSLLEKVAEKLLGNIPNDDPVIFDLQMDPARAAYDLESLGEQDLEKLMAVRPADSYRRKMTTQKEI